MVFVSVGAGIDIAKMGRNVIVVEDMVGRVCVFGAPSLSSDQKRCNRRTVQVQSLQLVHWCYVQTVGGLCCQIADLMFVSSREHFPNLRCQAREPLRFRTLTALIQD